MLKLNGNRLLVSPKLPLSQSKGGIFLPAQSMESRNVGTVIAIGNTVDEQFLNKDIMFHLQSAKDFNYGETQGKMIFVTDVIAIL